MATTKDAYMWTPEDGLRHGGFACEGAISPPQKIKSPPSTIYDVLIVGGGYAGLAAARDLTNAGKYEKYPIWQSGSNGSFRAICTSYRRA